MTIDTLNMQCNHITLHANGGTASKVERSNKIYDVTIPAHSYDITDE